MSQTGARQEVENFYCLINQWKETRGLIENQLYSVLSHTGSRKIMQELDKMEECLRLTPEWNSCRNLSDVRLAMVGTDNSRKSLLVNKYLYGTLDVDIPNEKEIRHKKDFYLDGNNQLMLIREITGVPTKQVSIWADTMMFVFSLENMESFNSVFTSYQLMEEHRFRHGQEPIPSVLIGIQDSSIQRCVTHSDALSLATNHMNNSPYIEVIPETGINVDSSFQKACKSVAASRSTSPVAKKSKSSETPFSEAAVAINGNGPYKLVRQSSLPSNSAHKRKKVNKKLNHMKSNYEITNGVPLLGTGRDIPIKESKVLKRGNKRKKDWRKKLLVLTQSTLTYYPSTHAFFLTLKFTFAKIEKVLGNISQDYMDQANGKYINLLHCTVKIPGKDPTGVTRSTNSTVRTAETFPRALRMHSITEVSPQRKIDFCQIGRNSGFMSDGALSDMSDEEDMFSASAVFAKPASFVNPLFTHNPTSPIDDSFLNKLFKGKDNFSETEEDTGIFYSSPDARVVSADKKKTPKIFKSGHIRGKSDATLQKFLVPTGTENNVGTFEFHIVSLDGRYWVFDAGSSEEQDNWIKLIEQQIHAALIATTGDNNAIRQSIVKTSEVAGIRNVKGNHVCCDCLAPVPEWASINLGTVICVHCSSVHRQLGTHVSRIKSLELDEWTVQQLSLARSLGNDLARSVWECTSQAKGYTPPNYTTCTRKERETWIRLKYEERTFLKELITNNTTLQERLRSAVEREDLSEVYSLLPYCTPELLNHQDPISKQTILHTSVITDNSSLSLLLVWNHIDSQLADTDGKLAIDYARNPLCEVLSQLTNTWPSNPLKPFSAV